MRWSLLFITLFSFGLWAGECADNASYPARGQHNNSELSMDSNTQIIGGPPDGLLPFEASDPGVLPSDTCGSGTQCQVQGCHIIDPGIPSFPSFSSNNDVDVSTSGSTVTFGAGGDETGYVFGQITISDGTARFLPPQGGNEYEIKTLQLQSNGVLKLAPGTYWVKSAIIDGDGKIEVDGTGTVYLNVKGALDITSNATVNYDAGGNYDPDKLQLSVDNTFSMYSNTKLGAVVYSKLDATLDSNAEFYGRIAAKNLEMKSNAKLCRYAECALTPPISVSINTTAASDALTCQPHNITVNVLNNGLSHTTYEGTVTFSASTNKGDWAVLTGSGTLNNATLDDGAATYDFHLDDAGSAVFTLDHKYAGDVTYNLGDGTDSADGTISFRPYGFRVVGGLANQIANKPFSITLKAVGMNDTNPGCELIEEYAGVKTLELWSQYINPSSPTGNKSVEINDTLLGKSSGAATSISISFTNGQSTTSLNARYPDTGKIEIRARDDVGIGAPPSATNNEIIGGSSVIINPYRLAIAAVVKTSGGGANPATQASGAGFIRAANPDPGSLSSVDRFDATVSAYIDCSDSGGPCSSPSSEILAESFQGTLTFTPSLDFPATGVMGVLKLAADTDLNHTMTSYGSETVSQFTYDEVGSINLAVKSDDYLEAGNHIALSAAVRVGRFYPAYLAWNSFNEQASCNDLYTYMDHQDIAVSYTLTAYNQSDGITLNYDDSKGYPSAGATPVTGTFEYTVFSNDTTKLNLTNRLVSPATNRNWSAGVYQLVITPGSDRLMFGKRSDGLADGPYWIADSTRLHLGLRAIGVDGEALMDTSGASPAMCLPGSGDMADNNICLLGELKDVLYGRLAAQSRHGSELAKIRVPLYSQYYSGSQFTINERDNCTNINLSMHSYQSGPLYIPAQIPPIPVGSGSSNLSIINAQSVQGELNLLYSTPTTTDRGTFNYFVDLNHTGTPLCWLRYDWDGGGISNSCGSGNATYCAAASRADDCISGKVTFGLYRGNDRVISRREVTY